MSRKRALREMRATHCGDKVRHATRIDAVVALARSLPPGDPERMEPYVCKFCHGWHNGHPRVEALLAYDPNCITCSHAAMTHATFAGGLGCYECDCIDSREYVYRRALQRGERRIAALVRKNKRAYALLRASIAMLPRAFAGQVRERFAIISRRYGKDSES